MNAWIRKYLPVALLGMAVLVGGVFFFGLQKDKMEGIVYGNGRIEAQSIDVATRNAARIAGMPVQEGQMVKAGDVVAELDLNDLSASLAGAEANVRAREQQRDSLASAVKQAESALALAEKEFARVDDLARDKAVSESRRDQALNARQSAASALDAARQNLAGASEGVAVAEADVDRLKELLTDRSLRAPKAGRILYKLVEPGEFVPAGGKVVTLLDLTDVYMSIFLPAADIARIRMGSEARIVFDEMADIVIPAHVSYISPEAQFTPRQVETRTEREKLTFRVKVRIPPALLGKYIDAVKTGLPGVAYIKLDAEGDWPDSLKVKPELLKASVEPVVEPAPSLSTMLDSLEVSSTNPRASPAAKP